MDTPENLEKKTKEKNTLIITVEDPKNNMATLKEKIPQIEEIKLLKEEQDNTKQYSITSNEQIDLRKILFEILPKEEITILELKKSETTLEEAFIKLIDSNKDEEPIIEEKSKEDKKKEKMEKKEKEKAEKKEKKENRAKEKEEKKLKEKNQKEEGGKK